MSKSHNAIKQTKKQPLLSPKERKLAKRMKKQQHGTPIVPVVTH